MRLICLTFSAMLLSTASVAEEPAREQDEEVPKLESTTIKPKQPIDCGPDCDAEYRLPPDQLQRLREIEGNSPGMIIPMTPVLENRPRPQDSRSGF